jgi:hypothetical protein
MPDGFLRIVPDKPKNEMQDFSDLESVVHTENKLQGTGRVKLF